MRTPRWAGLGLASTAAVALALGGCSTDSDGSPSAGASTAPSTGAEPTSSSSGGAADPAAVEALAAATAKLGTTSFKVTMTSGSGLKIIGLMDPPNSAGTVDLTATGTNTEIKVETLLVDQDLYLKVPGVTKDGTWTHVDVSRLPEGANVGLRPGQIDPVNTAELLKSTTDVRQTGPGSFAGTIDLTSAAGIAGVDQKTITTYGDQAQDVPFTAGVDAEGRLSALTVQLPAVGGQQAQPLEVLYTDYGTKVDAARPAAAEITEAPDSLYTSLGG